MVGVAFSCVRCGSFSIAAINRKAIVANPASSSLARSLSRHFRFQEFTTTHVQYMRRRA